MSQDLHDSSSFSWATRLILAKPRFDVLEHRLWSYSSKCFGFQAGLRRYDTYVFRSNTNENTLDLLKATPKQKQFHQVPKYIVRPNGLADGLWDVLSGFMMVSLLKSSANTENCMFCWVYCGILRTKQG
jgi:hypothetical protein